MYNLELEKNRNVVLIGQFFNLNDPIDQLEITISDNLSALI